MNRDYKQKTLWHSLTESHFTQEDLVWPPAAEEPITGKLLVRADYSLVSPGTERLITSETIPAAAAQRMRVPYMRGAFNQSFTYGYSLVGTVIEGPDNYLNKRVHLLHPHQRFAIVATSDVCVLPEEYSPHKASLISNMETALNATWDAQLEIGDKVVVIGYGIIGTLVAGLAAAIPGIDVTVLEKNKQRAASAQSAGLAVCDNASEITHRPNVVFNTAANSSALQCAIDTVGVEGTVIELSWYGTRTSTLVLGDSFHYERKRIVASQVSQIPQRKSSQWNFERRKALVIKLLESVDHQSILEKEIPFNDADRFFNALRLAAPPERGIIINYQE